MSDAQAEKRRTMEMNTNFLIQAVLAVALFVAIYFLSRASSEAEKKLGSGKEEK